MMRAATRCQRLSMMTMTEPSRNRASSVPDEEALVVAMTIAPSAYSRNRMFDLFSLPTAKRAKARAAALRGVVRHLARAEAVSLKQRSGLLELSYELPRVHYVRTMTLSVAEATAVNYLATRLEIDCPEIPGSSPELLSSILARLAGGLRLLS